MKELPQFPTIRQEAQFGGIASEYHLRLMLARGELPGFFSGRTFHIHHAQFVEKMNRICQENGRKEATV